MNHNVPLASRSLTLCPLSDVPEVPVRVSSRRIVHTLDEISRELAHGQIPVTDNREALIALGFVRDRPQEPLDTMWSRAVESSDVRDGYKRQIIERAELFPPAIPADERANR